MSLYNFLMETRTKEELAKQVAKLAREKADLQNKVHEPEHTVFWLNVKERKDGHGLG